MAAIYNALNTSKDPFDGNKFNEAFFKFFGGHTVSYDWKDRRVPIIEGFMQNPDVKAIMDQQATKTASIPRYVKTVKDEQKRMALDHLRLATKHSYTPQQQFKARLLEVESYDDNLLPMPIDRPNPLESWNELIKLFKIFYKLTGNYYAYKMMPESGLNAGEPQQIYTLPAHMMQIVLKNGADLLYPFESPIDYYMLVEGNQYIKFQPEEIIHIKTPNPNFDLNGSHLYGIGALQAGFKNLESSNEASRLNVKTMKNGGAFGFFHAADGQPPLTPEQAADLKGRLIEMDKSSKRLSKIAGTSAKIGFTRISLNTDELKPFDFLTWDRKVIANLLGWSDLLLNNDARGDYGGTISEIRKQLMMDNIIPDLNIFSEAFNKNFIQKFKGYENAVLEFDYSELPEMQDDMKKLVDWLTVALNDGVITRNEYRLCLKYPESKNDEMDVITVGKSIKTLENALLDNEFDAAFRGAINESVNQNE